MSVTIIVPCFNEAENVPRIARDLGAVAAQMATEESVELLFVDDGSRDETASLLEAAKWPVPMRVLRHPTNRGLGAAVRTGVVHGSTDALIVTDADGTYDFATIPRLRALLSGRIGIVTASPYHPDGAVEGVPGYRLALSRGASTVYRLLVDRSVHTYTAMYRAYRSDVIRSTPFDSDGFLAMTEIMVNALRAGHRVAEFPATLRQRAFGQSKARVLQITRSHVRFIARIIATPSGQPVSRRLPVSAEI